MTMQPPRERNILVADDGSASSAFALSHAVLAARQSGSLVTIMRVVLRTAGAMAMAGVAPGQLVSHLEIEAEADLRRRIARVPRDVQATTRMRHGYAAEEIIAELNEGNYDVVMLGARGIGESPRESLGSVAERVLAASPVPVAIFHVPES